MAKYRNSIWWIAVVIILLFFNFPIIGTLFTSLKNDLDISSTPPKWIFLPTLDHYRNVLYAAGYDFPDFFLNSAIVALGAGFLTIFINLPAAYSIVRYSTGGKSLFTFVVSLRLLPPIIFAIPLFILFSLSNLVDTTLGLILVNTLMNTPLALLLFVGFVQDFPRELEEAGKIDGANTLQILRYLVFPLMLPSIAAVSALSFIWAWNEYLFAFILTFRQATTVTVGASLFITAWGIRWGDIAAAMFLSVIPTLAFIFFVQRYLVRGLTLGAVKG
jgi:multiple sugar transport system permease protein